MTYLQGCESDPGQNDPLIFSLSFFSAHASNVLRDLIAYSHIYVILYFGCVPRYNKFGLFWLLLPTFGNFWLLLATFGYFWLLLATFGYFWQLFATFGNFLQLLAACGNLWLLLTTFGNFWLLCSIFLLQILASCCNF